MISIIQIPQLRHFFIQALIYVDAYALKLKHLLQSFNRKEEELPSIFADLIRMAEDCADKNIDGEGPPSYLLTDLEATFFEYQRAQTQIDEAGTIIFTSIYCNSSI